MFQWVKQWINRICSKPDSSKAMGRNKVGREDLLGNLLFLIALGLNVMMWFSFYFFKEPLPVRDTVCLHVWGFCMLEPVPVPLSRLTIYTDVVWWSILRFDGETCLRFALKQFRIGPRAIGRIYNWSKEVYVQCWNRLVMSIWEFVNHFALLFFLKTSTVDR